MADYSNRNTYLKMMLGDSSVSNTNVPNIKDYIGNIMELCQRRGSCGDHQGSSKKYPQGLQFLDVFEYV